VFDSIIASIYTLVFYYAALSKKPHKALHVRPSVRLVPMIYFKPESRRNFSVGEDMTLDSSNWARKFEVKITKVKVTVNKKTYKLIHSFVRFNSDSKAYKAKKSVFRVNIFVKRYARVVVHGK